MKKGNYIGWFLMLILGAGQLQAQVLQSDLLPPKLPVELDAGIYLYKVFDINTVDETFAVDGYFTYSWTDPRMAFDSSLYHTDKITYFNDRIDNLRESTLWFPEVEFINTLGLREIANRSLVIKNNGYLLYVERFHATFKQELVFHRFPFDIQQLKIQLEPFTFTTKDVVFKSISFSRASGKDPIQTDGWDILGRGTDIGDSYEDDEYLDSLKAAQAGSKVMTAKMVKRYSHVECHLTVKRDPGYYIWQLIFPLVIIMLVSTVVFWIEDYPTQIGVGFTLMLTIVAFNFFAETLLPKLPYNTFIEVLIMLGYMFLLLCIFILVYLNGYKQRHPKRGAIWVKRIRIIYPLALILIMFLSSVVYFGTWIINYFRGTGHI